MESHLLSPPFLSWIFPLFLFVFGVIAFMKMVYPNHFSEYVKLPLNDKYIVIYEKKERKIHLFTFFLFFLQWFSLSLFFYVCGQIYDLQFPVSTGFLFLDIAVLLLLLLGLKLVVQTSIAQVFELRGFSKGYMFSRIAYSSYGAILVVVMLFFILYAVSLEKKYIYLLFGILLIINVLGWISIVKSNQKMIKPYIIYFILYLCTLEIAPYVFFIYGIRFL
ncbi:DUF4271 domain-containing protein [Capnocytophaga sp. H2931]|uniref:DUF4271 domain-containing protein n=1 Tax=Capnocytophaga sp. H2931 TaxID=1945657 RepID=UPI000BB18F8D|nr:DUF4271 domain-containing protein [Capnocytophaga sp. H2931]ATA75445.1 DUF4271 domain-containing protein [Capnocytophaga sp. H2931]